MPTTDAPSAPLHHPVSDHSATEVTAPNNKMGNEKTDPEEKVASSDVTSGQCFDTNDNDKHKTDGNDAHQCKTDRVDNNNITSNHKQSYIEMKSTKDNSVDTKDERIVLVENDFIDVSNSQNNSDCLESDKPYTPVKESTSADIFYDVNELSGKVDAGVPPTEVSISGTCSKKAELNSYSVEKIPPQIKSSKQNCIGEMPSTTITLDPNTCTNSNPLVIIEGAVNIRGQDSDLYRDMFGDEDESPDLTDHNVEFDEESLNPSSLPFESLNSSFQYSVLIDSEDEEDDDNNGDNDDSMTDCELNTIDKQRLSFGSVGGIHDSIDLLSTEAENQLECCDQWSLGSCSLGGFECRTLEKRRRSLGAKEDERKLSVGDVKLDKSCTIEEHVNDSVITYNNLNDESANKCNNNNENISVYKDIPRHKNIGESSISNTSLATSRKHSTDSADISVPFNKEAITVVPECSNNAVANEGDKCILTMPAGDSQPQQRTSASPQCSPLQNASVDVSVNCADVTSTDAAVVHTCIIDKPGTATSPATNKEEYSQQTSSIDTMSVSKVSSATAGKPVLPKVFDVDSRPATITGSHRTEESKSTSLSHNPTHSALVDQSFRRNCNMQPCTVILPPCIAEEPDVLEAEWLADVLMHDDSRSSESSEQSGSVVGAADEDQTDDASSTRSARTNDQLQHNCTAHDHNSEQLNNCRRSSGKSEASSNDLKLRSYVGKSMLPGLSGLHGLSSVRHSSHSLDNHNIKSDASSHQCNNNGDSFASTEDCKQQNQHSKIPQSTTTSTTTTTTTTSNNEEIAWVSRRLQAHRQLSSSDSWGSEDFESYSSNDEDCGGGSSIREDTKAATNTNNNNESSMNSSKLSTDSKVSADSVSTITSTGSGTSAGREKLKARLLRKREQWRERRQSSSKEFRLQQQQQQRKDSKEDQQQEALQDVHAESGKLSRWFSLRKSVNYDLDRKTGTLNSANQSGNTNNKCDTDNANIPTSNDTLYSSQPTAAQLPISSTLSSISSFSSNSSSSTTSSNSSFGAAHHHFQQVNSSPLRLPQLVELEERMTELDASTNPSNFYQNSCGGLGSLGANTFQRKHQPPSLPPIPPGLTAAQIKRRHIVASIVHSENNYVATLHRLVREYRKPLEDSKPPILSQSKVGILFHYVHEILQCHTMFRIALTECVRQWDREEKIGDVFFGCFSKGVVLDIYTEFINNFTRAMEVAKMESRKKSVFADFLKMRQITSPDRLSFFGMMVKPVQRFPQFILFLQDLLKHTPKGHQDRMSLQLALTQLESLAETLNEQKRESEQHQAFKATLKQINSKFALRNITEGNRCLIRQDDVSKLEFGPTGLIKQTKERRLFLTTDTVICVSVVPKNTDDFNSLNERLSLKWVHPITDIEVQENNSSLTLSRLLAAGLSQRSNSQAPSTLGPNANLTTKTSVSDMYNSCSSLEESEAMVGALCAEMNDLMHDYQVVSRIAGLVDTLNGEYQTLNSSSLQQVMAIIQENIQARDDRMSWLDGCCLQFRTGKDKEVMAFHVQDPTIKKDWIIELRLAQLAVSSVNSPAWDTGDVSNQRPPSRRPLFVTALPILHASQHTQVVCGCQYPLAELPRSVPLRGVAGGAGRRGTKMHTAVWLGSTDGVTSHVTRYVTHLGGLRECTRVTLREVCVTGMLHVPPAKHDSRATLALDTVWIGTLQNRLLLYSGSACDSQEELLNTELPAAVASLIYHCQQVFIGLTDGSLLVYSRCAADGSWSMADPVNIQLSDCASVTALLPVSTQLYAAVADTVLVLDCSSLTVTKQLCVHHGESVSLLAHSGIGLWLCEAGSSTVCLYHTESFRHLQDIDLAPSVTRMIGVSLAACNVVVTALVVSRGLLWVGTSVGVTLTLPLPRLQGIPIISGRPTLTYHAHNGPVTFLMTLMPHEYVTLPAQNKDQQSGTNQHSKDKDVAQPKGSENINSNDSNAAKGRDNLSTSRIELLRKASTLPRGFGGGSGGATMSGMEATLADMGGPLSGSGTGGSDDGEVLGLCGDLLRHWSEESTVAGSGGDASDALRRSDPSLSCMSSTLDRRLRLRAGRPRSLDLSSASIDSKMSAATTASSGSEEGHVVYGRQRTIREDLANDTIPESEQSRKNSTQDLPPDVVTSSTDGNQSTNDYQLEQLPAKLTQALSSTLTKLDDDQSADAVKTISVEGENIKSASMDASVSESITPTLDKSQSSSVSKTSEVKKRSSHRRSSSDLTRKSLSSSASNISSLYYDGDTENFMDTLKIAVKINKEDQCRKTADVKNGTAGFNSTTDGDPLSRKNSINTLNRSVSALNRSSTTKPVSGKGGKSFNAKKNTTEAEQPRTVLVVTAGQGYKCLREDTPVNGPPHNNTDAHLLIWEMKL